MRSFTLVLASLVFVGCKSECERAIDHLAHLSWEETLASQKRLLEERPDVAKVMPAESDMLPSLRKVGQRRFGTRCSDATFTACVLAAPDTQAIAACEQPQ